MREEKKWVGIKRKIRKIMGKNRSMKKTRGKRGRGGRRKVRRMIREE